MKKIRKKAIKLEDGTTEFIEETIIYYDVYFLFKGDKIIYIGFTSNILNRIETHKTDKDFDSFFVLQSFDNAYDAKNLETMVIKLLYNFSDMPLLNKNDTGSFFGQYSKKIDINTDYSYLID